MRVNDRCPNIYCILLYIVYCISLYIIQVLSRVCLTRAEYLVHTMWKSMFNFTMYMGVNDRCPNAQICRGLGTCSNLRWHYHAPCLYHLYLHLCMYLHLYLYLYFYHLWRSGHWLLVFVFVGWAYVQHIRCKKI